jgi:sulfate adenylyltransferase subunit 1 (EFTu-like GTPase family)
VTQPYPRAYVVLVFNHRWGSGPCLTDTIDAFAPSGRAAAQLPLRMPIRDIFRNARGSSLLGGKIEVRVLPKADRVQHCRNDHASKHLAYLCHTAVVPEVRLSGSRPAVPRSPFVVHCRVVR